MPRTYSACADPTYYVPVSRTRFRMLREHVPGEHVPGERCILRFRTILTAIYIQARAGDMMLATFGQADSKGARREGAGETSRRRAVETRKDHALSVGPASLLAAVHSRRGRPAYASPSSSPAHTSAASSLVGCAFVRSVGCN